MKSIIYILSLLFSFNSFAQERSLSGAYRSQGQEITNLYLITDNYISLINYKNKDYLSTMGGPYTYNGETITFKLEYADQYPDSVGLVKNIPIQAIDNNSFLFAGNKVSKVPNKPQDLDGLWRITGRKSGETLHIIPISPRKTIKILVDGYFQWVAINPEVKGFYGSGGGTYIFQTGHYKENILFFSRDNSRVGNSLTFDAVRQDGQWHHSGTSSKGDPIYEIWTPE